VLLTPEAKASGAFFLGWAGWREVSSPPEFGYGDCTMIDRYTKLVLTIIAIALSMIAWTNLRSSMQAQAQSNLSCPSENPCAVILRGYNQEGFNAYPLPVRMK
jgi:hypothetical protein